jgi:hypothetical protein
LALKRELAKPLSLQNIFEHAKKHEADIKIKQLEKQMERDESRKRV